MLMVKNEWYNTTGFRNACCDGLATHCGLLFQTLVGQIHQQIILELVPDLEARYRYHRRGYGGHAGSVISASLF